MKLAVGYPWSSPFFFTGAMDNMLALERPAETRFFRGSGWCPARRHIHICEQALAWGADLICIIGADQLHPPDMLTRLLARHKEGYEVVSALVPARGYVSWQDMKPFQPMGWRFKAAVGDDIAQISAVRAYRTWDLDKDMLEAVNPADGDMQRVDFIGSGVLMFHRDHLLALERPWFFETVRQEDCQRTANMDATFVWRLQMEAHAKTWVDTTIKVRHLHVFEIDESFAGRFADWAEGGGDPEICRYREQAA